MITYSDLVRLPTFEDRVKACSLVDIPYESPAPGNKFYKSRVWRLFREEIKRRDLGCDLALWPDFVGGAMYVHHLDPLLQNDLDLMSPKCLDPENVIVVSLRTHNLIHYGGENRQAVVERKPGDTKLW